MTIEDFRRLALSLPQAVESAHQGHPDFRVRGKIFATIIYPDEGYGMVKLTPDQQKAYAKAEPEVFAPVKGGWGVKGATTVCLEPADETTVRHALVDAWKNVAPKTLAASVDLDDE
jgi:hypothetical protein